MKRSCGCWKSLCSSSREEQAIPRGFGSLAYPSPGQCMIAKPLTNGCLVCLIPLVPGKPDSAKHPLQQGLAPVTHHISIFLGHQTSFHFSAQRCWFIHNSGSSPACNPLPLQALPWVMPISFLFTPFPQHSQSQLRYTLLRGAFLESSAMFS